MARALAEKPDCWVTVACPLKPEDVPLKTVVKVLVENGYAVDFRREIPVEDAPRWFQHQGIYAYSRKSRDEFTSLSQNKLELERSLEQMRIMGIRPIRIVHSPYESISVDVPSDANAVEALLYEHRMQRLPDGQPERT